MLKYTIFRTKWGYFGLAGTDDVLCRTCLPQSEPGKVKLHLLKNLSHHHQVIKFDFNKDLFRTLQEQIIRYFGGEKVDFDPTVQIVFSHFAPFTIKVLNTCRRIKFGRVVSYSDLAKNSGRPNAVRAVGNALAKNPLPLIIPCHRVIRSNGRIGGFSASGCQRLKEKLILFEQSVM